MPTINISGAIAAAGADQLLVAHNTNRRGFSVQNNSAGDLWINELGSPALAAQPSIKIAPGSLYETPDTAYIPYAVRIFGATLAQAFTAREW